MSRSDTTQSRGLKGKKHQRHCVAQTLSSLYTTAEGNWTQAKPAGAQAENVIGGCKGGAVKRKPHPKSPGSGGHVRPHTTLRQETTERKGKKPTFADIEARRVSFVPAPRHTAPHGTSAGKSRGAPAFGEPMRDYTHKYRVLGPYPDAAARA